MNKYILIILAFCGLCFNSVVFAQPDDIFNGKAYSIGDMHVEYFHDRIYSIGDMRVEYQDDASLYSGKYIRIIQKK